MTKVNNRSVSAEGNITGSIIQTGDRNRATLTATQLPPAASVDIAEVIAALKGELLALDTPDVGKIGRALADAEEEVGKAEPDAKEVSGSVERALGYAEKAANFSEHVGKVQDLVTRIGGWLGPSSPYLATLLAAAGLSAS